MSNKLRPFKIIYFLLSLLLFVVSLEALSFAYINFYLKQSTDEFRSALQQQQANLSRSEFTAHPIFSYVSTSHMSNNMGFINKFDYPYTRQQNDYVIGLFGGSVADIMSWKSEELKVTNLIKEQVPALKNKNIVILNFATGCAKQPMQYHRFSKFADDIDFAINIDGFNEIEFNTLGADITSPCLMDALYPQSTYNPNFRHFINVLISESNTLKIEMLKSGFFEKSATYALLTQFVVSFRNKIEYDLTAKLFDFNSSRKSKLYPFDLKADQRDLHFLGALSWAKYTRLELAVAQELRVPILFVLQPSILFQNTKTLSKEEQDLDASILEKGKPWSSKSKDITRGYLELQKQLDLLKKKNANNFLDLTGIFKSHKQTLYVDPCCHYTDEGNVMIWTEVAKSMNKLIK